MASVNLIGTLYEVALLGGSGSGDFGHSGRPGEVGGSGEGGGESVGDIIKRTDADPRVQEAEKHIVQVGDARDRPGVFGPDGNYTEKADAENQSIADSFMNPDSKPREGEAPVAIFIFGKPGAGKTTMLRGMVAEGNTLPPVTMINADDVKEKIPGYTPELASAFHERSCDITRNYLTPMAIKARYNVAFDATNNAQRMLKESEDLKASGYKIVVLHADVSDNVSASRVYDRFLSTGRYVPVRVALSYGNRPTLAYNAIKAGPADEWRQYDTSTQPHRLTDSGSRSSKKAGFSEIEGRIRCSGFGYSRWNLPWLEAIEGRGRFNFEALEIRKLYSEDQERDEHGRWTSGGGVGIASREDQDKQAGELKGYCAMVATIQKPPPGFATSPSQLLVDHGQAYHVDENSFKGERGKVHGCYMNAAGLALGNKDMTYVEGYTSVNGVPIEHAWCVGKNGNVIDPTIKPSLKNPPGGYFGIPIKTSYLEQRLIKQKVYGILPFHTNQELYREGSANFIQKNVKQLSELLIGTSLDLVQILGGSGSGNFGHEGRPGEVGGSGEGGSIKTTSNSEMRALRAKNSYNPATFEKQQLAVGVEKQVADSVGGTNLPDREPFDVVSGRNAIEVKTIVGGRNPKITMHGDSLERKMSFLRKNKMKAWTVAVDHRGAAPVVYLRKGLGSFNLYKMEKVGSMQQLGLRFK